MLDKWIWGQAFSEVGVGGNILDMGTGSGKIVDLTIKQGADQKKITAIDLNSSFIKWCQANWTKVAFLQTGCTQVDQVLEPEQFDLITAHMLLNHLDDQQFGQTLHAVANLLKPGGHFLYLVPDPKSKAEKHKEEISPYIQSAVVTEKAPWWRLANVDYHYRTERLETNLIAQASLQLVEAKRFGLPDGPGNAHAWGLAGIDPLKKKRRFVTVTKTQKVLRGSRL